MKVKLISVGKNMPAWIQQGFQEYCKRFPPAIKFELIEIPLHKRGKNQDTPRLMQKEAHQMLAALAADDQVIALDISGQSWDTLQLAQKLQSWQDSAQNIALFIGGPEGLHPHCLERAQLHWSLSKLTLPHPLVRVIVAEQFYRAWSINSGHPYHR